MLEFHRSYGRVHCRDFSEERTQQNVLPIGGKQDVGNQFGKFLGRGIGTLLREGKSNDGDTLEVSAHQCFVDGDFVGEIMMDRTYARAGRFGDSVDRRILCANLLQYLCGCFKDRIDRLFVQFRLKAGGDGTKRHVRTLPAALEKENAIFNVHVRLPRDAVRAPRRRVPRSDHFL